MGLLSFLIEEHGMVIISDDLIIISDLVYLIYLFYLIYLLDLFI